MDKDCRQLALPLCAMNLCALTGVVGDVVATCRLSAIVLARACYASVAHSNPGPDVGSCHSQSIELATTQREGYALLAHFQGRRLELLDIGMPARNLVLVPHIRQKVLEGQS